MAALSVIIAAHNAGQTLEQTLESLRLAIDSAMQEVEVILLNDSSEDNTQSIIDEYASRFPGIVTQQVTFRNIGQVRKHAVLLAKGQYITMLDSDDQLKPASLRDAVEFLQQHQPDMLLTHLLEIRDCSKITDEWSGFSPVSLTSQEAVRRFLIHKDFQAHLIGQFIHRDLYLKFPIPPMTCYEDFAVFPAMINFASKIYYQRHGCYYYIKRNDSLSSVIDRLKIDALVSCTLSMEKVFAKKFTPLIGCHWLDIYTRYQHMLNESDKKIVTQRVSNLYSLKFFLATDVRLSYKKKALKALWKK
ncbi:glycosyltransferase family 2 protein [Enterobacteriaceae bacterium C34A]